MPLEDILKFEVRLFSRDGENSPVLDYLHDLHNITPSLAIDAIRDVYALPEKYYLFSDIKPLKIRKKKAYELRVRSGNNICRLCFIIESPQIIIVYGFTKKTQKTEKKDLAMCLKYIDEYQETKCSIPLPKVSL